MNNDRAVQFAPFASLRGYYDLVSQQERLTQSRRELTDEETAKINAALTAVKKGDMLKVVYYDTDCYRTIVGICRGIDPLMRTLVILSTVIPTDDIIYVEIE